MTPEEVVRAILAAWDHLDADEVMNWFAVDAEWENVPIRSVSGYQAIRKEVEGFMGPMTSFSAEILNLAVSGNFVATERVDHIGYRSYQFESRIMGAFEVEADRISAWRDYFQMPNRTSGPTRTER